MERYAASVRIAYTKEGITGPSLAIAPGSFDKKTVCGRSNYVRDVLVHRESAHVPALNAIEKTEAGSYWGARVANQIMDHRVGAGPRAVLSDLAKNIFRDGFHR